MRMSLFHLTEIDQNRIFQTIFNNNTKWQEISSRKQITQM